MVGTPQFEFPTQMRELAERNVEQMRAACGQFMDAARKAQDMFATMVPENAMTAGMKQVQERTCDLLSTIWMPALRWRASSPRQKTSRR